MQETYILEDAMNMIS